MNNTPLNNKDHDDNPWRLTGVALKPVKMRMEGSNEVVDGFQILLQFLDKEPNLLITKDGDKGHKAVQFAIPKGAPVESLYDLFRQLPETIEQHLNPEASNGGTEETAEAE